MSAPDDDLTSDEADSESPRLGKRGAAILAATAGGSALGVMGLSQSDNDGTGAGGSGFVEPQPSPNKTWRRMDQKVQMTTTVDHVPLKAYTSGSIYEDDSLDEVNEILPGDDHVPLVATFAAQVNVEQTGLGGDLLYGAVDSQRVINDAEQPIRNILENEFGVESLQATETESSVPGQAEHSREFKGRYSLSQAQQITLPDGREETVQLEGTVPVRVFMSSWGVEGSVDKIVAGGVYPGWKTTTLVGSVTDALGVGIDAAIDIDLGTKPAEHRERIVQFIESLQPGN